ncbi:MAG: DUF3482 domain-containing protein [Myxococcota bacterium]
MSEVPVFAIVGRVNKGKSSIVATLAEDESVAIAPRPGTTRTCREYPVRIDGEVLFTLVDTPGFEEAPRALEWLRRRETSAASRPALVAELLRAFEGTDELVAERRLLAPVVAGASILYVVDGTKPYRPNYEAEMEILRWTGQPGMALINRIGEGDHVAEWRRALDQYFKIVRDFDAFLVTFDERVRLLRTFRELRDDQAEAIDRAVAALQADRRHRQVETAAILTELLTDALTLTLHETATDPGELDQQRDRLEQRFHETLRARELAARREVERLYRHDRSRWSEPDMEPPVFERDLFARETWNLLGLTPGQQVVAGTVAGAVVGGTVDALVGGASFLAGTALGSLVGGGSALYGVGRRFAQVRTTGARSLGDLGGLGDELRRYLEGRRRFTIGPHAQPNFPWVLLDRALLHYASVLTRTHARRDAVRLGDAERRAGEGLVAGLSDGARRDLNRAFARLRKSPDDPPPEARRTIYENVLALIEKLEPRVAANGR